jgi:hypothetical protein
MISLGLTSLARLRDSCLREGHSALTDALARACDGMCVVAAVRDEAVSRSAGQTSRARSLAN